MRAAAGTLRSLRLLAANPDGLDAAAASHHLGRSTAATRTLLESLCRSGYIEVSPADLAAGGGPTYRLRPARPWGGGDGPSAGASSGPRPTALPAMLSDAVTELHRRTGARAYLAEWADDDHVDVVDVRGHERMARIPALPDRLPPSMANALAVSKTLVAHSPDRRHRLESGSWRRHTPSTIVSPDALDLELARIRRDGYAIDREEFAEGFSCVSAPIADPSGRVSACISVSLPAPRFAVESAGLISAVTSVAREAHRRWYR